ncbi:hypothetical protein [Brevundimonas viscosa]|uniref:Lipoprotein n=1 Tax=Brevundimonas viscosa TaxID=871741 RepID=A0A1I6Q268_9CAUL|nr:hypothetical protein [Brevundimonas viscosa]SFS46514.1 hypothetical protein SAMN05192570_1491 [Brevundimonas viscosa]
MIRRLLLSSAVLALAACGAENAAAPEAAPEPTPPPVASSTTPQLTAEGWGPLRIGMTRAEVVAALGEDANPEAVGGPDPASCDEFRPERAPEAMLVMIERDRLTRISLIRPSDVTTDRGYGVGDPGDGIAAAYGAGAVREPHKYEPAPAGYITAWSRGGGTGYVEDPDARGLVFEVGQDGAVKAIRAGGPSIQYVEGCA